MNDLELRAGTWRKVSPFRAFPRTCQAPPYFAAPMSLGTPHFPDGRLWNFVGDQNYLKYYTKKVLLKSGLLPFAGRLLPLSIAILKYHSIQDEPKRYLHALGTGIVQSTAAFRSQMEVVAHRFNPVSLDDVILFLMGAARLPPKPVAITFDDGYLDNFEIALPILNRLGIPAAFYVTIRPVQTGQAPWFCRLRYAFAKTRRTAWFDSADNCERQIAESSERYAAFLVASRRCAQKAGNAQEECLATIERELEVDPCTEKLMMSWDQVRALRKSAHIVGSHTVTHPNLAQVKPDDLRRECVDSKTKLEEELGAPVTHFSYPSPILQPHWNEETVETTASVGYECGVTSTAGPVKLGDRALSLQRVAVPTDAEELNWVLENCMLGRR